MIVSRKNQLYSINVTGLTTDEIEQQLEAIVAMAGDGTAPHGVGECRTARCPLHCPLPTALLAAQPPCPVLSGKAPNSTEQNSSRQH